MHVQITLEALRGWACSRIDELRPRKRAGTLKGEECGCPLPGIKLQKTIQQARGKQSFLAAIAIASWNFFLAMQWRRSEKNQEQITDKQAIK